MFLRGDLKNSFQNTDSHTSLCRPASREASASWVGFVWEHPESHKIRESGFPCMTQISTVLLIVPSASYCYSGETELCDRKGVITVSEILIFTGFRRFFEKYLFLTTFYSGTQYESNSARRAVSAKSCLLESSWVILPINRRFFVNIFFNLIKM